MTRATPAELHPKILAYYFAPHSLRETAVEFSLSVETVRRVVLRHGLIPHAHGVKGCRPRSGPQA